jgi:hypothetical protein
MDPITMPRKMAVDLIWAEYELRLDSEISEAAAIRLAPFMDLIYGQMGYEEVNGAAPARGREGEA